MRLLTVVLPVLFALACGGSHGGATEPKPSKWKGALRFYPFEAGSQWSFRLQSQPGVPSMLKIDKVIAFDGQIAVVTSGNETRTYRVQPDGIVREASGAYLLKWPMKLGDKWPGANGAGVEVTKIDQKVTVDAGTFEGCLETTETSHGDNAGVLRTVFCPDVGPVEIEIRELNPPPGETPQFVVGRLLAFGPPAALGSGK